MVFRRIVMIITTLVLFAISFSHQTVEAQSGTCSTLVETAIEALGDNCTGLGRNSTCYGTFRVEAAFSDPNAAAMFSQPADQTSISSLQSIRTFPFDAIANEWGVAVINAQANVPGSLPGQNAVFLLIGDAEMENAVDPETAFMPSEPRDLQTQSDTTLVLEPDAASEVVSAIAAGETISVDAISEDGEWLRTAYNDLAGWVSRAAVSAEEDMNTLAVYTAESFTPMQAFYFRTGVGSDCTEAPNSVIIQGPENLTIDINANGADIRLGSTIMLETIPFDGDDSSLEGVGGLFRLSVLDGHAVLYPHSDNPISIPEGQTTLACLSEAQDLGADGESNDFTVLEDCGEVRPMTLEELTRIATVNGIELNYPIDVEQYLETSTCQPNGSWTFSYVVRPGDSLSGIAGAAGVSTQALAQGNCLDDVNLIYAGQVLRVPALIRLSTPAPTMTPTVVPPTSVPPTDVPATGVPPTSEPATAVPPTGVPPTAESPTPTSTPEPTLTPTPTITNTPAPEADLALATSPDDYTPDSGQMVTFTVAIINQGPEATDNVVVSDIIPYGDDETVMGYEGSNPSTGTFDYTTGTWTIGSLANGAYAELLVSYYVPYDAGGVTYTLTPYISASDTPDSNTANNIATNSLTVQEGTQPPA